MELVRQIRNYCVLLFYCLVMASCIAGFNLVEGQELEIRKIVLAEIVDTDKIKVILPGKQKIVVKEDFRITPVRKIHHVERNNDGLYLKTDPIDLSISHFLRYRGESIEIQPAKILDTFYSEKELGCRWNVDHTFFRLFAPRALQVTLILLENFRETQGAEYEMTRDGNGVWECTLPGHYFGKYYNYRIDGPKSSTELFNPINLICDPYSKAVVSRNEFLHRGSTLIINPSGYDWQGDTWVKHAWEDLIIYECHVRDLTAHPSSGVHPDLAGSYTGILQPDSRGGLNYIKSLGVNAVELLPVHEFANIEIPYDVPVDGVVNDWNPYSRNHWGYMTSYFFAPESYYASGATVKAGAYCGENGRQVSELKDLIKVLHKEGIAVILDVVYNHVANYDQNCFRHIDKKYYFHLNGDQSFRSASGCGNDFKSDRPMARKLILDSIKYWLKEYHVDGFRFDLAPLIDWQTIDMVAEEARKINPHVILISEAWGGGKYEITEFSRRGWIAWNDQFRNGVKGQNPENGQSFIFGRYFDYNSRDTIKRYIRGNLRQDGGLFDKAAHSLNYLESHDDHTLGDFIRIGSGKIRPHQVIADVNQNARLTENELKLHKLAALILFASQGPVMLGEGQEFGRSKVITETTVPEPNAGKIDHNSYNKDNETNWINYDHAEMNSELVAYYQGLVRLRKAHPAFRCSPRKSIRFLETADPFAIGFMLQKNGSGDANDFLVLVNGNRDARVQFRLPRGPWKVVVDQQKAGTEELRTFNEAAILLPASSGMVLMR